jgi:nucleoside-diphosphate-sugar epimerase
MNEELADVFGRCFGMEFVGLRYFNVYGPRQDPDGPYAAVIPRFFSANLGGQPAVIYGDGEQSRDFTFVADAVRANMLAAETDSGSCATAYNVGGGERTTVNELARLVAQAVGGAPGPRHEPARPGDVAHSLADLARVKAGLGYAPGVSLPDGLRRALAHYSQASTRSGRAAEAAGNP